MIQLFLTEDVKMIVQDLFLVGIVFLMLLEQFLIALLLVGIHSTFLKLKDVMMGIQSMVMDVVLCAPLNLVSHVKMFCFKLQFAGLFVVTA